jgi:hypothetical protein
MSIFNLFKPKGRPTSFSGGNGDSFESAVIVDADNASARVQAEQDYIARQCGQAQKDWKVMGNRLQEHEGKLYDVLVIGLANGQVRTFHFGRAEVSGK